MADLDTESLKRKARHFMQLARVEDEQPETQEEIDDMVAEFQQQSAAVLPKNMQVLLDNDNKFKLQCLNKRHGVALFLKAHRTPRPLIIPPEFCRKRSRPGATPGHWRRTASCSPTSSSQALFHLARPHT